MYGAKMNFNQKTIQYGIVQCDPIPEIETLQSYYKDKYYQESKGSYDVKYTEEEIEHKIYEADLIVYSLMRYVDKKNIGSYNILELGCGEGFLLSQASKTGFNVLGVDHSSFGLKKWHPNLKDNFVECDIYEFLKNENKQGTFDFCVLKNVLEHIIDPAELLSKMKYILKPEGKLIITVPNDYSRLQKKLLDLSLVSTEGWFCPPDHLYYFNTDNFSCYVKSLGFNILDMYSSFPVDMYLFNKYSNYFNDPTKGKEAHYSRIRIDLLIKESGFCEALDLYRSMAKCGIGRNFTTILGK
jgi:SAM-dependent methyltransferase